MNSPIEERHRLAVLHAQGVTDEWINADGREKHMVVRWLRGEDPFNAFNYQDKLAQAIANAEAAGRADRVAMNEGVQRVIDRVCRLLDEEFGRTPSTPPPPSSSGLVGAINDVFSFHDAMDCPVLDSPQWPGDQRAQLRLDMALEEFLELAGAMGVDELTLERAKALNWQVNDADGPSQAAQIVAIADALIDKIYIDVGTLLEFGIRGDRVWAVVHAANMAKRGGPVREDGKRLKPEGWIPPDVYAAVFGPVKP